MHGATNEKYELKNGGLHYFDSISWEKKPYPGRVPESEYVEEEVIRYEFLPEIIVRDPTNGNALMPLPVNATPGKGNTNAFKPGSQAQSGNGTPAGAGAAAAAAAQQELRAAADAQVAAAAAARAAGAPNTGEIKVA